VLAEEEAQKLSDQLGKLSCTDPKAGDGSSDLSSSESRETRLPSIRAMSHSASIARPR
jgi:hypothetical protein